MTDLIMQEVKAINELYLKGMSCFEKIEDKLILLSKTLQEMPTPSPKALLPVQEDELG